MITVFCGLSAVMYLFNGKRVEAGDWIVTFPNGTKEIFSNSVFIELFEND